jgi:1,2-diacylglycerol 3-alpha-glucosyltransferase
MPEPHSALPSDAAPAATQRPLNIAFFVEGMFSSGVDTSTQLLARALRREGHRVTLFTPWKEHQQTSPDVDSYLLPAVNINAKQRVHLSYPVSLRLLSFVREQRYDLIHVHTSTSVNLLAWQVSKLFHLPVVYTYHTMSKNYLHYLGPFSEHMGSWLTAVVELYDKVICDRAHLIVTPSAKAAAYLGELGVSPEVQVIPNGIDLDRFYPFPSDYLSEHFAVRSQDKVLLFVGRLNQEKRPLLAYDLFHKLSRLRDDVQLVMVGDGPLQHEISQRARQDGLSERVTLTGLVPYAQMPAVYNAAHVWISTSQSEVQPMVALEAAACGLPAVAFADLALQGVIEHGVNGFVVERSDLFLTQLANLLDGPVRYQAMRKAAIERGKQFSVEATARRLVNCYRQVIDRFGPPFNEAAQHRRPNPAGEPFLVN